MVEEVQEALNSNYNDIEGAFEFFLSHEQEYNRNNNEITYTGFSKGINALLPSRFDNKEVEFIWRKFTEGMRSLTIQQFQLLFDTKKFSGSRIVSTSK